MIPGAARGSEEPSFNKTEPELRSSVQLLLHPLALLSLWVCVGLLFGVQNYAEMRFSANHMTLRDSLILWGLYTFCDGSAFLAIWLPLKSRIQTASWRYLVFKLLPLTILAGALSEMAYARIFPFFVQPSHKLTYWARVRTDLSGEWLSNVAFFWIAIFLARGIGYYEAARTREANNLQLQRELMNAQLRALRMQLNPHFLFNTLNGISGLMREDVDRADVVLEQLGQLLRITLDRGDHPFVSLQEEIEFIRQYLEIQCARFGERLQYQLEVPTHLYDAVVPTMILQPIVENAYTHGIASSSKKGYIAVSVHESEGNLRIDVTNSGGGQPSVKSGYGIGLENVRARLRLHYGPAHVFSLGEVRPGVTVASLSLPLNKDQRLQRNNK